MDLAAAYLAAEELISSIPTVTESGRLKSASIYNAVSYLLDDSVSAWYKRVATQDRLPDIESGRIPWEKMFNMLVHVPWIVPVYAKTGGIDMVVNRKLHLFSAPTYLLKEVPWGDQALMFGWRGGPPYKGLQCVGLVICPYTITLDEPRLDFTASSTRREVYSNARSSLLEMGATNTRNMPCAGIVRASNVTLCPIGMNRLLSIWRLNTQGALYNPSPIQRWIGLQIPDDKWEYDEKFFTPIVIGKWSNEIEAQLAVEALFFQVATLSTWNYIQGSLDLRSDPLSMVFKPTTLPSEYKSLRRIIPLAIRASAKKREKNAFDGDVGFILHSLLKVIRSKKIHLPRKTLGIVEAVRLFMIDSDIRRKTINDLSAVKSSAKFDPKRVKRLRGIIETIRMVASLNERKKLLEKLRAELMLKDHFYWDIESGIRLMCEHEMSVITDLTRGISDPDAIVQKFSRTSLSGIDAEVSSPAILECKYCGQDLGTIWLVNVTSPDEEEYARQIEGSYLDSDIGIIIGKLLSSQAIQTKVLPSDITKVVDAVINGPLGAEFAKMAKGSTRDRPIKERFLTLAAIVSVLLAIEKSNGPLTFNIPALEALMSKEYIDILQKVGLLPKTAVQRMIEYWPKTLSKHLPNPQTTIRNAIAEMTGTGDSAALLEIYQSSTAYPVNMKIGQNLSDIDHNKVKSPSAKLYIEEMKMVGLIKPDQLKFYSIKRFNYTPKEPRLYVPKSVPPIIRSSEAGRASEEDAEESFAEAISSICPELILRPISGNAFYKSRKIDESDTPQIYANTIKLGSHTITSSNGKRFCKFCLIPFGYRYDKSYYTKYRKAIESIEKRSFAKAFECSVHTKPKPVEKADIKLDASLDKELQSEFSHKFGWSLGPDRSILTELSRILSAIGYQGIAIMFASELSKTVERVHNISKNESIKHDNHSSEPTSTLLTKLILTGWNLFMKWMLKQKDDLAIRTLNRFRSIRALEDGTK